jgi:hypothetical protein
MQRLKIKKGAANWRMQSAEQHCHRINDGTEDRQHRPSDWLR